MSEEPTILELRIHGVLNTPPSVMLHCAPDAVKPVEINGIAQCDSLAGFYERSPRNGGDRRIAVEAYSWGNLDQTTVNSGFLGKLGRAVVNVGWLLLVPFGLINAAYWSRPVRHRRGAAGGEPVDVAGEDGQDGQLRAGPGAGSVRLFALLMTLLYTTSFATASMDLFAVQCFPAVSTGGKVCPGIGGLISAPGPLAFLAEWNRGQRLAAMSTIPLLAVIALLLISVRGNSKYRKVVLHKAADVAAAGEGAPSPAARDDLPVLAAPRFWDRTFVTSATGLVHVGASLALLVVLLCSDALADSVPQECRTTSGWFSAPCYSSVIGKLSESGLQFAVVLVAGALLLLLGTVLVVVWSAELRFPRPAAPGADRDSPEGIHQGLRAWQRPAAVVYLGVCAAGFGLALVFVATQGDGGTQRTSFAGTSTTALVVLGLMTILALVACLTRSWVPAWVTFPLILTSTLGLLYWAAVGQGAGEYVALLFPIGAVVALAIIVPARRSGDYGQQSWAGAGPGVWLFLSLFGGAFLATALPIAAAQICRGGSLLGPPTPPPAFGAVGGVQFAFVIGATLLLLGILATSLSGSGSIPFPAVIPREAWMEADILRARRKMAIAHRSEPILGIAAIATWAAITLALLAAATRNASGGNGQAWLGHTAEFLADSISGAGVFVGIVGVLAEAIRGATTSSGRPIPVLWDLMCWMPRAAHPFGPACYSERTVPEIGDRVIEWLGRGREHRVILSAHSLGAVLAVSSLFDLHSRGYDGDVERRIQLLTYGVQLRSYFGRGFPELLGPHVLGVRALRMPALFAADPWGRQVLADSAAGQRLVPARSLLGLLGDQPNATGRRAWLSLWRRTDYLGFPLNSYGEEDEELGLDRYAEEISPGVYLACVADHGFYWLTEAYARARDTLVARS